MTHVAIESRGDSAVVGVGGVLRCDLWAKVKGWGICSQAALQEETSAAWQFWDGVSVQNTVMYPYICMYIGIDRRVTYLMDTIRQTIQCTEFRVCVT